MIKNARADVFRDWDTVLGAATQNAPLVPGIDPFKAELEGFLAQARDLKIQQETLEGQRMGITQKLDKVIEDGAESARKVRGYARIHLGSDNKALKQFGVAPRVRRGSKKAKPPEETTGAPPPSVGTASNSQHNQAEPAQQKEEKQNV